MSTVNNRRNFLKGTVALGATLSTTLSAQSVSGSKVQQGNSSQEYYEWRAYRTASAEKKATVSDYIKKALIPALERIGIDRIGVFTHKTISMTTRYIC